ncbi:bifunctional folylpolyglutamate synthase/dihydrofolate synthase [Staphylococcus massiliensis]|uniref:bifunctional folylpolyglutamate synthase/dihydrofolate synthase n=1 Tax=Staphylococcus massiliensis TaxID=555791 RepID=UPI001EE0BF06|nr:folylpolyglutamate synthase/dihydrofolate synthase family protein [Staphylococcus massiliensis]MCG3399097.1 bifunctional folylpolyglutamate synthase/dihydrofolate synthase [Staphylococcus massiliensis]MCG3400905.1 bifunctional folylpolyglutamate synthase/dihydrofolate synthase [Staphylococcus massiliensis]MCG3412442.1 bifunctional folylpolyglutamate synthase/dihydrofolate synthase [Staphylococcus massiliensis]
MNYLDSLYWIHEQKKFGIKPGVKRMEWMLEQLDHPERQIRGIHVGGTNGKGSTVSYLKSALVDNGYDVGTFTSPYIETFNERISFNGHPITNDELVDLVARVKPICEALSVETDLGTATEFEIITTMMFLYFGQIRPVDFVIVEAGLGVKNDSTNVFKPIMSILTSIGLDHTDILGQTYLDIARDKAHIIKEDTPVIYSVKDPDALKYIREFAEKSNAKAIEIGREITVISEDDEFTYRYKDYELENLVLNMIGDHQKENASLAITALLELKEAGIVELDFNKMIDGIEAVNWTGRLEQVSESPLIILDGAHNTESIEASVKSIRDYYHLDQVDVLFAAIDGKPVQSMIHQLSQIATTFNVTDFDFPKALPRHTLYDEVEHDNKALIHDYQTFIKEYEGPGLLIVGSLYFISEVKLNMKF